MQIQGLQKLTLLDYPSRVACTLFAHGCNLRCPFCHNASLVVRKPENIIKHSEISDFLQKRKGILDGVCLTGGEPLMHNDVLEFLRYLRGFGYKIKLDTNGFYPEKLIAAIENRLIDYVAMDIKASRVNYAAAVGVQDIDITPVCESVEILMNSCMEYEFRTTAVKGLHTASDFEDISDWLRGAKHYYIQHFSDSGDLICNKFESFSAEEMHGFLSIVKQKIPHSELRGN